MSNNFIVAYSSQDKFEIPEKVAAALMKAKDQHLGGVEFNGRYYSTSFLWIMPVQETSQKVLSPKQLKLAGEIAIWLSDPVHELGWNETLAVEYSMKLLRRCSFENVREIWRLYALGAYPNAKKFLIEAKQLDSTPDTTQYALIETNLIP